MAIYIPELRRHVMLPILAILFVCCGFNASSAGVTYMFKSVDRAFDSVGRLLLEKEFYFRHEPDAHDAVGRLKAMAAASDNPQLSARALFWEVRTGQLRGKPDEQIVKLKKARAMSDGKYEYDNAFIDYQLAGNYQRIGKYFTAYQLLHQAIPVFGRYGDDYSLGNAYLLLGLIYKDIGEIEQAEHSIESARLHYLKVGFPLNRVFFFQALLEPDSEKSLRLYKRSFAAGAHEPPMSVQALVNISDIFLMEERLDSASFYAAKADSIISGPLDGNEVFMAMLRYQQACIALRQGAYGEVLEYCGFTDSVAAKYPGEDLAPSGWLIRSRALEGLGRTSEAFEALKRHQSLQDENMQTAEAREIHKDRERQAISAQRETAAEMRRQHDRHRTQMYIYLLALGVLIAASAGVCVALWQRSEIRKIRNRELRTNLERQMAVTMLNRENFERDMQRKECEISTSVLLLSNKNDVLKRIGDITREFAEEGRIPGEYVNRINDVVGNSLKNDDDWSRFKLHFEGVHPSFFTNLTKRSDELTENDLRLCAYLRIGMRAKEIAAMLGVSAASVNTARYRLRKRLHLGKDESLDDFIRRI